MRIVLFYYLKETHKVQEADACRDRVELTDEEKNLIADAQDERAINHIFAEQ